MRVTLEICTVVRATDDLKRVAWALVRTESDTLKLPSKLTGFRLDSIKAES